MQQHQFVNCINSPIENGKIRSLLIMHPLLSKKRSGLNVDGSGHTSGSM